MISILQNSLVLACFLAAIGGISPAVSQAQSDPSQARMVELHSSSDGALLVTGGESIRVLDARSGEIALKLRLPLKTSTVRFSPSMSSLVAAGNDEGEILLCEVPQAEGVAKTEPIRILSGHSGGIRDLAFSPDGTMLASCSVMREKGALGEFKLWKADSGAILHSVEQTRCAVTCVSFSADNRLVAFAVNFNRKDTPSQIDVYNIESWQLVKSITFSPGYALSLSFTPDGQQIVVAGGVCVPNRKGCKPTGNLWLADLKSDSPAVLMESPSKTFFRSARVLPDGIRYVAVTSTPVAGEGELVTEIQMRHVGTGRILWSQKGEKGEPTGLTVLTDGQCVAIGTQGSIQILDADTGRLSRQFSPRE